MTDLISALLIAALAVLLATAAAGAVVAVLAPRPVAAAADAPLGASRRPLVNLLVPGVASGAALLVAASALRAVATGHAPWSNLHEFSVAFAAMLLLAFLGLSRGVPIAGLAPLAAALASGLIGVALSLDEAIQPLVPALQQPLLLTVHVGAAVAAYAVAGVAFLAAAGEIGQRVAGGRVALLPPATVLRTVGHRAVLIGFPILTVAIVLGSVWANLAWRAYWSNDPKELAAAATWLVFGAYLHVAARTDRWGRLAPWLIVLGFAGVLFTYLGAGLFIVGEHSYGGS